jgi:aminoglycoside phosphotransferase (APT) family kinase protein
MIQHPQVAAPEISDVLRLVRTLFGACRVVAVELFPEGFRNLNYRVQFDSGREPLVLRIYGPDPNAWRNEVALLENLRKAGIPVPEVVAAHGDGFASIPVFSGRPFIVTRYVEGVTFRELKARRNLRATAEAAYSIGETVAAFHTAAVYDRCTNECPAGLSPVLETPNALLATLSDCLRSTVLIARLDSITRQRLHELAQEHFEELNSIARENNLVHGDFGNRNVLVHLKEGRWQVAAVIDWEFARIGPALLDIGGFLRYERRSRPVREPHFSRGYLAAGGTLPNNWWRLARVVDLIKQCATLAHEGLPESVVREVAELVQRTADEECLA